MFVEAYDTAEPQARAKETVLFEINRNPNCPVFMQPFYSISLSQNKDIGAQIGQVTAIDNDGDNVYYTLDVSNSNVGTFLSIDYESGALLLRRSLDIAPSFLQFSVVARDTLAFSSCTGIATVQIIIKKDQFPPVFSLPDYQTTIVETSPVNSTVPILSIQATDNDLEVSKLMCFWYLICYSTRVRHGLVFSQNSIAAIVC